MCVIATLAVSDSRRKVRKTQSMDELWKKMRKGGKDE